MVLALDLSSCPTAYGAQDVAKMSAQADALVLESDNPYFPSLAQQMHSQMSDVARSSFSQGAILSGALIASSATGSPTGASGGRDERAPYDSTGADSFRDVSLCNDRTITTTTTTADGNASSRLIDEDVLTPLADASSYLSISTPNTYSAARGGSSFYGAREGARGAAEYEGVWTPLTSDSCSSSSSSSFSMPATPSSSLGRSSGGRGLPTNHNAGPIAKDRTIDDGGFSTCKAQGYSPLSSPTMQVPHHHPYGPRPTKPAPSQASGRVPLQPLDVGNLSNLLSGNGQFLHPAAARKAALAHAARLAPAMQSAKSMPGSPSQPQTRVEQQPKPQFARVPPSIVPRGTSTNVSAETGTVSSRYLSKYPLPNSFNSRYILGDELGSGGFGFVVVANRVLDGREVAIKFIFKDKVPVHGWIRDNLLGVVPIEVAVLQRVRHSGVIEFIDYMETEKFAILVMELFGKGWGKDEQHKNTLAAGQNQTLQPCGLVEPKSAPPCITSHPSSEAMDIDPAAHGSSELSSEPDSFDGPETPLNTTYQTVALSPPSSPSPAPSKKPSLTLSFASPPPNSRFNVGRNPHIYAAIPSPAALTPPTRPPLLVRRSSHDLFECIEAAGPGGFSEKQVQYIFAQVVEVVWHLEKLGVCHRDIKDENIVIDDKLRVKLIDFGSASVQDPSQAPRYYDRFYGTVNAAAPEILAGRPYIAPQAEVWSLGVLLYTILFGECPFANTQATMLGRISSPRNGLAGKVGRDCREVLGLCLEVDSTRRATISEIRASRWVEAGRRALNRQNAIEAVNRQHPRSSSG